MRIVSLMAETVEGGVAVEATSTISKASHKMILPLSMVDFDEGMEKWDGGWLVQDAFPTLSDEQREFLVTGITPEEWEKEFGDES